jgi:hypothetical protein
MISSRVARILTGGYLLLMTCAIGYELGIRLFDRGNSEFAGMLSAALSVPMSLVTIAIAKAITGLNPGDSDTAFVVILGLSALANGSMLWVILRAVSRPTGPPG